MTREEALNTLQRCIPSFNRKYIHWDKLVDKDEDMSWLYLDETFRKWKSEDDKPYLLPKVIPADYLVGVEAVVDGKTYHSKFNGRIDPHSKCKVPMRHVALDITDYGLYGNTHKYGNLDVSGVEWNEDGTDKRSFGSIFSAKYDPRISPKWKIDIRKILSPEDVGEKNCDWSGYEAGEATSRFSDLDELLCSAAYVTLLRFEGPLYLNIGAYYVVPEMDDYLLQVDDKDDVTINPRLKAAIKRMTEGE